jgi:hypothetical protein
MKTNRFLILGVLLLGATPALAQAPQLSVPEPSPSASVTQRVADRHHRRLSPAGGGQTKDLGGTRALR